MDSILPHAVLYGALQALAIALGVALKKRKQAGHLALIAMMCMLGLWQLHTALDLLDVPRTLLALFGVLHFPAMLCFPAFLYAYLVRLFYKEENIGVYGRIGAGAFAAGLLVVLACLFWFPHRAGDWRAVAVATWSTGDEIQRDPRLWYLSYLARPLSLVVGGVFVARIVRERLDDLALRRLRWGTIVLLGIGLAGTALSLLAQYRVRLDGTTHGYGAFLVSLSIAGLFVLNQSMHRFFDPGERSTGRARSALGPVDRGRMRRALETLLEREELYRTENLNLVMLAAALADEMGERIRPQQVSEFINLEYKRNFNQYVNEYRVRAACEQLRADPGRSVLDIALDVGFNSKSTFNAAFRAVTGRTPSQYRRGEA